MDLSSGLQDFETTFARLAFDLAASADPGQSMTALLAAQRAALLEPVQPLLSVLSAMEEDGAEVEVRVPRGIEVPKRIAPVLSEFVVEGVRNWKAHGKQSRAERKFAAKEERCRALLSIELRQGGLSLAFHDDGPGLNPSAIMDRLKRSGRIASSDLSMLELAGARGDLGPFFTFIFKDGATIREAPSLDAGNGVGLSRLESLVSGLGGRITAGTSPRLGGFVLSCEVPCSLIGAAVDGSGEGLVRVQGGDGAPSPDSGDFRIFYSIPPESRAWAGQNFGGVQVSWISLVTPSAGAPGFRALGLRSDPSDV
jgi:hypothetical protein